MRKHASFVGEKPTKVNPKKSPPVGFKPIADSTLDRKMGLYLKGGAVLLDATEFVFNCDEYLISHEFSDDWFEY